MIEVDGSFGEGGGQILRTAVSLAAVLGKDVRIFNIRVGRSQPGLKAQHLTGVRAAASICDADLKGAEVGSTELTFKPSSLKAGSFRFDVGTAGSITLVVQTLMPLMAFAPGKIEVEITGGTDVKWSPPIDYLLNVVLPILNKLGYHATLEVFRRGHYPRGGGHIRLTASPVEALASLSKLETGRVLKVGGVSHARGLPRHVAERQSVAAENVLKRGGLPEPGIVVDWSDSKPGQSVGSGLVVYVETEEGSILGADSLGERGRPAEDVGSEAAGRLVEEVGSGAFLDRHMGDIVVPYLAMADGLSNVSVSRVTQHTLTNAKVAEWIAGVQIEVEGTLGSKGLLRAKGLGVHGVSSFSPTRSIVGSRL